ncbi:MAG: hypothetical protein LKF96_00145 [Treponema sp.]|nr:hypothetical protein [Treponema sp.]
MATVASNVARQQDESKMTEEVGQAATVRQNNEQAKQVKKAAAEETETLQVQADGRQAGKENFPAPKKKNPKKNSEPEKSDDDIFQEPYLGRHVDITR